MNTDPLNDRSRRDDLSSPADAPSTERERRYRTLFGAMDEGFCVVEMSFDDAGKAVDYSFLEFNDAFERMTGITAEAALAGKSARELFPALEDHWFETYGQVATTGESIRFENHAEPMGKWFEVHAFRIGGEGSREVGVLFKDISERRRGEIEQARLLAESRASRDFLDLVTDRLPVRIGYIGPDMRYRYLNGVYERTFGLLPGEGVGRTVVELAGEDSYRQAEPHLRRAFAGETNFQSFWVEYPFGRRRIEVNYIADPSEGGVVVHVSDVTGRYLEEQKVAEERVRQDRTLENAEVATFDWDVAADRVYANPLLAQFFGVSSVDAQGGPIATYFEAIHPEDRERTVALIQVSLTTGSRYEVEYRLIDASGRERNVLARGDTTLDADGVPVRLSGVVLDITERVRAEEAGRASEARYRTLFTTMSEGYCIVEVILDAEGRPEDYRFVAVNDAFERLTGIPLAAARSGRTIREIVPGIETFSIDLYGRVALSGSAEEYLQHAEKLDRWFEGQVAPFGNPGTHQVAVLFNDVTDRARAEIESERLIGVLAAEREKLDTILALSPSFVTILRGEELVFEYANPAYKRAVGRQDLVGKTLAEALPEVVSGGDAGQEYDRFLLEVMATGKTINFPSQPIKLETSPGVLEERTLDFAYQALQDSDGSWSAVLVHGTDVTDRARAEREIAEREELFRTVFEQAPDDAILVMDAARILTAWNPAAERIMGWSAEEAIGNSADIIFTPEGRAEGAPAQEIATAALKGKAEDGRWHLRKDGSRFWGSGTINALHDEGGAVRGYLKVFRDATARYEEAKALAFLSRLSEAILEGDDPEAMVQRVGRMLGEHLGASRVAFAEASPDGLTLTIRQEWGPAMPTLVAIHRLDDFGEHVAGEFRAGRTHVSFDAFEESGRPSGSSPLTEYRIGSGISVPVLTEGRLASVLIVHQATPRTWTEDEVGLVRQVADRVTSEIERGRAESALRASEERFRAAQENTPEPFAIMEAVRDGEGRIVDFRWSYVNPAAERMMGESEESLIGASVSERRESTLATELFKAYVRTVETGQPFTDEMRLTYGKREYYMRLAVSKVGDGVATSFTDLTERFVEAQTLAFLGLLTEAVVDANDPDHILLTMERMVADYLGVSRVTFGEFAGDEESFVVRQEWGPGTRSVLGAYGLSAFGELAVQTLRAGKTYVVRDAVAELGEGSALEAVRAIDVLSAVTVPIMKEGLLSAIFVVHHREPRDWTDDEIGLVQQVGDRMSSEIDRARAEAALRTSEERFRQLVELSPSTVWFGETDGGLRYISQDFYDATGLTPANALPHGWASTVHPDDFVRVVLEWETARREETPYDTEFRIRHRNGEYRWLSARALPVRDAEGRITGWLGNNSDIQEQKETEDTLRARVEERTQELQKAVQEAEGFNYSISHDLRTPLRAMVATSSILLEEIGDTLDEEYRGLLIRQAENAKRLGRLIDELLRLSRLARVPVNRERLDITEKVRSVFDEMTQSGDANGCQIDVQEGMVAQGDPGLVRTVLQNLIGNACKFSPHGGTVRIRQSRDVLSVADEGVGFDMQFAPKIFQPFERLVSESDFEGTGIGLANVKRIVERHGGRVWVESAPGKGATFSFTLGN